MDLADAPEVRHLSLRPMLLSDIPAVALLEQDAFDEGWPPTAFERELTKNGAARYIVLANGSNGTVHGVGGLWLMLDEAHVVIVAVRPQDRGKGLGGLLLAGLLDLSRSLGMTSATLECRVSNSSARALYRRFGFHEVGLRKRYYADNGEDALIMTTEDFDQPGFQQRLAVIAESLATTFPGISLRPTAGDGD